MLKDKPIFIILNPDGELHLCLHSFKEQLETYFYCSYCTIRNQWKDKEKMKKKNPLDVQKF